MRKANPQPWTPTVKCFQCGSTHGTKHMYACERCGVVLCKSCVVTRKYESPAGPQVVVGFCDPCIRDVDLQG
jgi:hypothetical protein